MSRNDTDTPSPNIQCGQGVDCETETTVLSHGIPTSETAHSFTAGDVTFVEDTSQENCNLQSIFDWL